MIGLILDRSSNRHSFLGSTSNGSEDVSILTTIGSIRSQTIDVLLVSNKVLGRKYVTVFVIIQVGVKAFVLITTDSTADSLAIYRSRSVPYC